MAQHLQTRESFLEERVFNRIKGVPLSGSSNRYWFPIHPCICVTEPCPCDTLDDIIVWLPADARSERTGKKYADDDIHSYQLERNSEVLVEIQIPMTVNELTRMKEIAERGHGKAFSIFQKSTKGKKPTVGALLIGAFELGWHIGEKIDEETGLSDKISDWLAENFPWPWR